MLDEKQMGGRLEISACIKHVLGIHNKFELSRMNVD